MPVLEILGLAVGVATIAGVYSVCVQIVEQYVAVCEMPDDFQSLRERFELAATLLERWGESMGIERDGSLHKHHHPILDDSGSRHLILAVLGRLQKLVEDRKQLAERYGFQARYHGAAVPAPNPIEKISEANTKSCTSKKHKTPWRTKWRYITVDKKKYENLVSTICGLVDQLYTFASPEDRNMEKLTEDLARMRLELGGETRKALEHLVHLEAQQRCITDHIAETRRLNVLNWLNAVSNEEELHHALSERHVDTCQWITKREEFLAWREFADDPFTHSYPCLWINGGPGCGKTFLFATIIEYLQNHCTYPIAYFFCVHEDKDKRDIMSVLRSWIFQLAVQRHVAFETVASFRQGREGRKPTEAELWMLLKAIIGRIEDCFLLVDGYDECADTYFRPLRTQFVQNMLREISTLDARVRFMIMSRRESGIAKDLLGFRNPNNDRPVVLEFPIIRADTKMDLISLSSSLVAQSLKGLEPKRRDEVARALCKKAQGQFLWIRLESNALRSGRKINRIIHALEKEIPNGVDMLYHLYGRCLERIEYATDRAQRSDAIEILRWAMYASRPLSVLEIADILEICPGKTGNYPEEDLPEDLEAFANFRILELCGSLLELRPVHREDGIGEHRIHFVHFSVKEFLLNYQDIGGQFSFVRALQNGQECHARLAEVCFTYVSFPEVTAYMREGSGHDESGEETTPNASEDGGSGLFPLLPYASGEAMNHVREANTCIPEICKRILLCSTCKVYDAWKIHLGFDAEDWYAHGGLQGIPAWDNRAEYSSASPLCFAAAFGCSYLCEMILDETQNAGAEVNRVYANSEFGTAFQAAIWGGNSRTVDCLLHRNADINIQAGFFGNALQISARFAPSQMTESLLIRKANINAIGGTFGTALTAAVFRGDEDTVKLLLRHNANPNAQGEEHCTPLVQALDFQDDTIIRILLEGGADVNQPSSEDFRFPGAFQLPLQVAAWTGSVEHVRLLLNKNANVGAHCATPEFGSPLHAAIGARRKTSLDILKMLLAHGADINSRWDTYNSGCYAGAYLTPLLWAACLGRPDFVDFLLDNGALKQPHRMLRVDRALFRTYRETYRALEAILDVKICAEGDHLQTEVFRGNIEGVKRQIANLQSASFQPEEFNKRLSMALGIAAQEGHFDIAQYLLESGAKPVSKGIQMVDSERYQEVSLDIYREIEKLLRIQIWPLGKPQENRPARKSVRPFYPVDLPSGRMPRTYRGKPRLKFFQRFESDTEDN